MTRILAPLAVVVALTTLVNGIKFTKPEAGSTLKAGSALSAAWQDGGDGPEIADLTTYTLWLCAGGNDVNTIQQLVQITPSGAFAAGNQAQGMVGTTVGANTPANAYFLQLIAVGQTGGTVTFYSDRFSYSGMTGTFPDPVAIKNGMKTVTGTGGPDTDDQTTQDPANAQPDEGEFAVEYTMQTGPTRYAPMQPVPKTKITKKKATPQYPTSSVNIAKAILPTPKIQTTITQSQTHSVSSMANTNAAAPMPSDDMAKFLARWKD